MTFVSSAHKRPVSESFIGVEGSWQKRLAVSSSGAELPKDVRAVMPHVVCELCSQTAGFRVVHWSGRILAKEACGQLFGGRAPEGRKGCHAFGSRVPEGHQRT
jgi:hypothetical protein